MANKMRSDIIIVKFAALCVEIFGQRSSRQQNEWDFMRACSGDSWNSNPTHSCYTWLIRSPSLQPPLLYIAINIEGAPVKFLYDAENNLLICLLCESATNPRTLDAHLRDSHRLTFPASSTRDAIASWAKGLRAHEDLQSMNINGPIPAIPHIPIHRQSLRGSLSTYFIC